MKIVRYETQPSAKFGCIEDGMVWELDGDPLVDPRRGQKVAMLDSVTLLEPCRPAKVVAIAINYVGIEGFSPTMLEPMIFVKPGSSVCAPGTPVVNPFPDLPWWGEAELGVVIKSRLKNASHEEAVAAVLGFTVGNDVTTENVEGRDHHLARSKCADSFCPIGPWIDTEFDSSNCLIEAVQNGEVIRSARSSQQFWQWPRILVEVSKWMTLEPWDVVLTGNPPDTVGMRFLSDGDVYTARIGGLGEITNQFFSKRNQ
ncbi:MAG: fumarylacetoacetate hydrolase family protein [Gemmatimonadaceae bacterium]|nr:fumarylacetoacetate hydrolase family protein [Gemmatimonadaceae bacterium]